MSLITSIIPYSSPKTPVEFLQQEFEKLQRELLVDLIYHTDTCGIGSIDEGKVTFWEKDECTAKKIILCTFLRFYQTGLSEVPEGIERLINLKVIDLAGNHLKTIPNWIGNLSLLEDLNLGRNRIEKLPDEITYLNQLTKINLYDNGLKTIPPQIFRIENLKKLYLDDNHIKTIPSQIGRLQKLEFLSIVQNGLVSIHPEIKNLPQLTTFCCLYDNNLDEASEKITQELGKVVEG